MPGRRKTKIVATMGPSLDDYEKMKHVLSYASVARFNFSHGSHKEHEKRLKMLHDIEEELGKHITAMADLEGPEIRTTNKDVILIEEGTAYSFDDFPIEDNDIVEELVDPGDVVLVDDGALVFIVIERQGRNLLLAENSGELKPNKSVVVRGKDLPLLSLSKADRSHVRFIKKAGFDAIAESFVREADDIISLRKLAGKEMIIIAKIESVSAVENLESIIDASDGVMIARGDLALSLPEERVPAIQMDIINIARRKRKPSIVATQMLESMTSVPMPTRAEVSDVYNAVLQGVDALMLSGETAKGKYPVHTIKLMDRVIREAEKHLKELDVPQLDVKDVIAKSAIKISDKYGCAIIAPTIHGTTPSKLSRQRPSKTIFCATPNERTIKYMNFFYGVYSCLFDYEPVFENCEKLKSLFGVNEAVFVFGYPPGNHATNTILHL